MTRDETDKWNRQRDRRVGRSIDTPGEGEEKAGNRVAGVDAGTGAGIGAGTGKPVAGRGERKLVAAFVATVGDVDICRYHIDRHVCQFADIVGYFPFLGFVGNRVGRIRGGEKRRKNG